MYYTIHHNHKKHFCCVGGKEMEMDEQPKKSGEEGGLMIKVATFIVDRRNLFFLLFGIALIFSVVSMNWTTVENALSAYLPETTETSRGDHRRENL